MEVSVLELWFFHFMTGDQFKGWYYFGPRDQGTDGKEPFYARKPTTKSAYAAKISNIICFRSCIHTLIGIIAFGSIIVALLEILHVVLNAARNNEMLLDIVSTHRRPLDLIYDD